MHITGVAIQEIWPFTDEVVLHFDCRVNVFIGPNGTGKSTLLRFLHEMTGHEGSRSYPPGGFTEADSYIAMWASDGWPTVPGVDASVEVGERVPKWCSLPFTVISATRLPLPLVDLGGNDPEYPPPEAADAGTLNQMFQNWPATNQFTGDIVEWATNKLLEKAESLGTPEAMENLNRAMEISFYCARSICREIINGTGPQNLEIAASDGRTGLFALPAKIRFGMAVATSDPRHTDGSKLPLHNLSSGTQGPLLWIRYLALQMLYHYDFKYGWQNQPAILLIDEIENHLHPTWQRRVIPALLEHFPGLQIFATTHSPFVVAGLKAGQVHLLNRDANGVVTASTNTEDIVGWTADEILRTMMGVDDPTDEATAAAARELRQLRSEGPRDTEDAEAARQTRMQELRRLVDRDLLAGGPMAARRELFEQQFNEALEKYRQSRDLGQDSG
ncbi:MAG: AAA family ATPase [Chloroflexota bacterium]|nr:AAA family ATPase [Chloroflexota bacterium]MDE2959971.1 AAA family ATPase [Chloroflexota bacterium]